MTKRNIAQGGRNARSGAGSVVFLFLPFAVSFFVFRFFDLDPAASPALLFCAALLLILFSASSLYGPLCLAAAFAILGVCARSLFDRLGLSLAVARAEPAAVLFLLPLFAGVFASAFLGLERSAELGREPGAFRSSAVRGCLLTSLAQTAMLAASFASAQVLFLHFA